GGSLIAYTVSGPTAVTLGDPIGPSEDAQSAIRAFLDHCKQNGWMAVFAMTESDYLDLYRRAGYVSMCLGHEGIVDLTAFTLKGNNHSTLRKRYNRLTREGYRLVIVEPPIRADLLRELRTVSDEWLELTHGEEKRFFLASFDEDYLRREYLALVYTPDGEISAFANLAPEYQRGGLSIDIMRHRKSFESGTMDFMFVALLFWGIEQGYTSFNLGLSPLFGMEFLAKRSLVENVMLFIRRHFHLNEYKGVHAFKIKFRPGWAPLFMVFPGWLNLPRAGLTVARVNAGKSETIWQYFQRRQPRPALPETNEEKCLPAPEAREEAA
ncbi:MAG: phosphatidylglycerol lysyltransferase domain-containing protein, partial [Chloroflexota bacterium]